MTKLWISFLTGLLSALPAAKAQGLVPHPQNPLGDAFSFYIENDTQILGGPNSDSDYTNGFRFSYTFADRKEPDWLPSILAWTEDLRKETSKPAAKFTVSLGHQIYTPRNITTSDFLPDDRPYAGWVYAAFSGDIRSENYLHALELSVGMIGPAALGEQVQNNFHDLIGVKRAYGWKHQLKNEPTLNIGYKRKLRFFELWNDYGRVFDLIPHYGGNLGNVLTAANTGLLLRVGHKLKDDFGASRLSSYDSGELLTSQGLDSFAGYFFAGAQVNGVLYNAFLDGGLIHREHSVSKYNFTFETEFGYSVSYKGFSYAWRFVTVSPEFRERSEFRSYASMMFSYARKF